MKKLSLLFAVTSVIASCISSCKKCYTCDFGANGGKQKFCSTDYPDKGQKGQRDLQLSIDAYEKNGYVCVED